jgi:Arc/MetJ family transcription regulator
LFISIRAAAEPIPLLMRVCLANSRVCTAEKQSDTTTSTTPTRLRTVSNTPGIPFRGIDRNLSHAKVVPQQPEQSRAVRDPDGFRIGEFKMSGSSARMPMNLCAVNSTLVASLRTRRSTIVLHGHAVPRYSSSMTRISVSLDDATAAAVQRAAGDGSVSGWVADLVRQALLHRAGQAAAAYDRVRDNADDEAARLAGAA